MTSSGSDEAAQRADAVTIKAFKPFAVMDMVTAGLDVLDAEMAKAKILVYGDATTTAKATAQAPFRWGLSDAQSAAVERRAKSSASSSSGRRPSSRAVTTSRSRPASSRAVYIPTLIDIGQFKGYFKKFGGTVADREQYTSNGTTFGDDTQAQEQAPIMVTKMKSSGVTTVIMFSDIAMNKAMMSQATKQEWFPEWYLTGAVFQDIAIFARAYPQEQAVHMFGESNLSPYTQPDPTPPPPTLPLSTQILALTWYWGSDRGHAGDVGGAARSGVADARHPHRRAQAHAEDVPAGPLLDPGVRRRGAGLHRPARSPATAGTPGCPTTSTWISVSTSRPCWWDPETTGPSNGTGTSGKGVLQLRQRREAIPREHLAEEAVRLVREGGRRRRLRHPPDADTRLRR